MVTQFNRKDLVSFGIFLLSEERKQSFQRFHDELLSQGQSPQPVEDNLRQVHHADVENWLHEQSLNYGTPVSFTEAFGAMMKGKRIRRQSWTHSDFIYIEKFGGKQVVTYETLEETGGNIEHSFENDEMLANDWIIKEK